MIKFALASIKSSSNHQCLLEIQETVNYGLKSLGFDSILTENLEIKDRQYIIFGANNLRFPNQIPLPLNSIIYNFDQIYSDSPWVKAGYIDYLLQYPIWDYSLINIAELKKWGVKNVQHVPVGYVPEMNKIHCISENNIDVLFYGSINNRRQKIIDDLEEKGVKVKVLFGVYGKERDDYIARSKIVLNMHFYEAKIFEIVRVSYLLANKIFVISETGSDFYEEQYFADGLVFCDYDNLVDSCLSYLHKEKERKDIAEKGFDLIKNRSESNYLKAVIPSIKLVNNKLQKFVPDFYRKRQAKICFDQNQYENAILLYQESLQVDLHCLESYWYLGLCFLYSGDDFSAQLTWSTGMSCGEELNIEESEIINDLQSILLKELAKQKKLNNQDLVNQISLFLD